jgi:hypothetical protein
MRKYKLNANDVYEAHKTHMGKLLWIPAGIAFLIGAGLCTVICRNYQPDLPFYRLIIPVAIIGIASLWVTPFALKRHISRVYARNPVLRQEVIPSFNAQGIIWRSGKMESCSTWIDVTRVEETPTLLVVYLEKRFMKPIPKAAFENPAELETFKSHLPKCV